MNNNVNISVRSLRALLKKTQEEFAGIIGIPRPVLTNIELENLVVTPRVIDKIENSLGIKLDDPRIVEFVSLKGQLNEAIDQADDKELAA